MSLEDRSYYSKNHVNNLEVNTSYTTWKWTPVTPHNKTSWCQHLCPVVPFSNHMDRYTGDHYANKCKTKAYISLSSLDYIQHHYSKTCLQERTPSDHRIFSQNGVLAVFTILWNLWRRDTCHAGTLSLGY